MGGRPDLIGVVEQAYRFDLQPDEWLRGLAAAMEPFHPSELGVSASAIEVGPTFELTWHHNVQLGDGNEIIAGGEQMWARMTPEQFRLAVRPFRLPGLLSLSERFERSRLIPSELGTFEADTERLSLVDQTALNVIEPTTKQLLWFGFHTGNRVSTMAADRRRWAQVAAHIGAAWRLRKTTAGVGLTAQEGAAAVLESDGRFAHAEDKRTKSESARHRLRAAALAIDRARGRLRRDDTDEALGIWTGLVSGTWSLLETFDTDGRRYMVARRNSPDVADPRSLTERERQVCAYASLGLSNKEIAYELGLSPTTISTHLSSATRKLGLDHRLELIPWFRSQAPSMEKAGARDTSEGE